MSSLQIWEQISVPLFPHPFFLPFFVLAPLKQLNFSYFTFDSTKPFAFNSKKWRNYTKKYVKSDLLVLHVSPVQTASQNSSLIIEEMCAKWAGFTAWSFYTSEIRWSRGRSHKFQVPIIKILKIIKGLQSGDKEIMTIPFLVTLLPQNVTQLQCTDWMEKRDRYLSRYAFISINNFLLWNRFQYKSVTRSSRWKSATVKLPIKRDQ